MEAIKREVGFKGTLEQFFDHIRTDPKLKYPNTAAGRDAYLTDARAVIASAMAAAPRYFSVLPKAALEVRAVEKCREATPPPAFYNPPSTEGRPEGRRVGKECVRTNRSRGEPEIKKKKRKQNT